MDNQNLTFLEDDKFDLSDILTPEELAEIELAAEKQLGATHSSNSEDFENEYEAKPESSEAYSEAYEETALQEDWTTIEHEAQPETAAELQLPAKKIGFFGIVARILSFVLATLLIIVAGALGVVYMLSRGPSDSIRDLFVLSLRETSAAGFVAGIFLSEDEIALIEDANRPDEILDSVDPSLISISHRSEGELEAGETGEVTPLEVVDVTGSTFNGKMMIVSDPERVIVGVSNQLGSAGQVLVDMIDSYGGVGGVNAGGFDDPNGTGNGGIPLGIVIHEGKLLYGGSTRAATMVIDYDGIMHVGNMTGNEAMALNAEWAVSFGPVLVVNGEKCDGLSSGLNPRTAIGQRADGAILLLVINGRQVGSMGATYEDVADVMLSFGAVNALNLDGGSSSSMIYEGEFLNISSSLVGQRPLPTGIVVLSEEAVK